MLCMAGASISTMYLLSIHSAVYGRSKYFCYVFAEYPFRCAGKYNENHMIDPTNKTLDDVAATSDEATPEQPLL